MPYGLSRKSEALSTEEIRITFTGRPASSAEDAGHPQADADTLCIMIERDNLLSTIKQKKSMI